MLPFADIEPIPLHESAVSHWEYRIFSLGRAGLRQPRSMSQCRARLGTDCRIGFVGTVRTTWVSTRVAGFATFVDLVSSFGMREFSYGNEILLQRGDVVCTAKQQVMLSLIGYS